MIARGYTGELPKTEPPVNPLAQRIFAISIPLTALIITTVTGVLT
jgi:hypothetical protein